MTFTQRLIRLPRSGTRRRADFTARCRADTSVPLQRSDESLPVTSNAIARMEYDPATQELTVTFARDGGQYTIAGITELEAHRMASSASPGKYFNAHVKGRY